MNWFKHKTDTHEDYQISDAFKKYGHLAYKFYFILHEVYAKYYNEHDKNDYVKISKQKLAKINNIYPRNIEKLLKYFKEKDKISYDIDGEIILFKILNFKKLHNRWIEREEKNKSTKSKIEEEAGNRTIESIEELLNEDAVEILDYLNFKTQKNFKEKRHIMPLLRKGYKIKDFIKVINNETKNEFFIKNKKLLNPMVLFKEANFDMYLNENEIEEEDEKKEQP